jgi:hypothetical protein
VIAELDSTQTHTHTCVYAGSGEVTLQKLLKAYEVVLPRHGARPEEDIYYYRCVCACTCVCVCARVCALTHLRLYVFMHAHMYGACFQRSLLAAHLHPQFKSVCSTQLCCKGACHRECCSTWWFTPLTTYNVPEELFWCWRAKKSIVIFPLHRLLLKLSLDPDPDWWGKFGRESGQLIAGRQR